MYKFFRGLCIAYLIGSVLGGIAIVNLFTKVGVNNFTCFLAFADTLLLFCSLLIIIYSEKKEVK